MTTRQNEFKSRRIDQTIGQYIFDRRSELFNEKIMKYIVKYNNIIESTRRKGINIVFRTNKQITSDDKIPNDLLTAINKMTLGTPYYSGALFFDPSSQSYLNENNPVDQINKLIRQGVLKKSEEKSESFGRLNKFNKIKQLTILNNPEFFESFRNKYKDIIDEDLNILKPSKEDIIKFKQLNNDWEDLINPIIEETLDEEESNIAKELINSGYSGARGRTKTSIPNAGQNCVYCGVKLPYGISGLDRAENNKTYLRSNVVLACPTCNQMKHELNVITFINKSKQVTEYMTRNNLTTDDAISSYIRRKNEELLKLIQEKKQSRIASRHNSINELFKASTSRYNKLQKIFKAAQGVLPEVYHADEPDQASELWDTRAEVADEYERRMELLKQWAEEEARTDHPLEPKDDPSFISDTLKRFDKDDQDFLGDNIPFNSWVENLNKSK